MSNILEVILNLVDNMTPGLESASGAVDSLESSVETTSNAIDNIDPAKFADLEAGAQAAGIDITAVGEAAAMAGVDISGIDPSSVKETSQSASEAAGELNEAAGSTDILSGALGALTSLGVATFLEQIAGSADTLNQQFNALTLNLDLSASGLDSAKQEINGLNSSTGISKETIRNFLNQYGMIGGTSVEAANGVMQTAASI